MRSTFRFASAVLACTAGLAVVGCTDNNNASGPSSFTLSVTLTGNGSGAVTSNSTPAINCGTACSVVLTEGTTTTLTAVAASGSVFGIWTGGGCTGSATPTCTLTVSAETPVSARFDLIDTPTPAGVIGLTSNQKLISFVRSAPDATPVSSVSITGLASGETVVGIDYRPSDGKLYGLIKSTSGARVCQLDPKFGAASACFPLRTAPLDATTAVALSGTAFGIDFNPTADRLRVVSSSGQNLRINVADGTTIVDSALSGAATGASAAAYTNNFPSSTGTALFVINDADDSLYLQNPPNSGTLTKVGALGVSTSGASGFDVIGTGAGTDDTSNEALMAAITGGLSRLYTVNLGSGAATLVASIETGADDSVTMVDLAVKPAGTQLAAGDTYALQDGNKLISFNRATPGTILTRTFVAGLKSGDQLVGMDFRFKDAKLYAIGYLANLYTIDTASGIATSVAALNGTGFSGFNTSAGFGVDFDPVADTSGAAAGSLQVIDSTSQRLSVVVEGDNAGTVTKLRNVYDPADIFDPTSEDTNHSGFRAIGYTNGFFNTASASLYAVDSNNDSLYSITQSGSFSGEVASIGGLGVDVDTKDGLDIDGITGDAWFVASVAGVKSIYQINLTSGVLAGAGSKIGDGSFDVRALALPAPKKPVVYGLTAEAPPRILTFAPDAPGTLLSGPLSVTGLNGGEELVALHFRPSDRKLFALSRVGNLYTVDPTPTAAPTSVYVATLVSGASLHGDPNDNASPFFSALPAGTIAVDFDPLAAAMTDVASLRIVNAVEGVSSGLYARANVSNGNTFADSLLALPSPGSAPCNGTGTTAGSLGVAGVAFAKSGSLYVIDADAGGNDSGSSCLYTATATGGTGSLTLLGPMFQGPVPAPPVGPANATGGTLNGTMGGFDIVGGHNGLSLAALDRGSSGQSTLNRVSLGSGSSPRAVELGVIGPAAPLTPKLIDMTILLSP